MQATLARCSLIAGSPVRRASVPSRTGGMRAVRLVVRAQEAATEQVEAPASEPVVAPSATPAVAAAAAPSTAAAAPAAAAAPFSAIQEVINGRAAMLGFLVAIGSELATNQSVWSQLAGRYVDRDLVESPVGAAPLFYAFVVIAVTFASFAPAIYAGQKPGDRAWGPFTAAAEMANGRAAMLGFLALLGVELVRGNLPLF